MHKYSVIGQSVQKNDVYEKVTGQAKYAADMEIPGILSLKVLRSQTAHALVKNIDTSEAVKVPGVAGIFTYKDVPGINGYGIIIKDQPVLTDKVRFIGDALALIAADNEEIATKAMELIKVDLEELPPLFDTQAALQDDAPAIHDAGNILVVSKVKKGNIDQAINSAYTVVTRRYTTQRIEHCYIETEAGIAYMENDILVIKAATQNTHYDRRDVARVLGLPMNKVRIIQTVTGGGFGGKLDISVQCFLGLAALKLKRPVRMVYNRHESFTASGKRHPFFIDYTSAVDKQGKLLGVKARIIGDTGAYASYGPATLIRAAVHATGPYEVPNVDIEATCVYTNNPFSGAMRGFGTPQMAFASESQMDILAKELKISPLEIRMKNIIRDGSITATGQLMEGDIGIAKTMKAAWEKALKVMPGLKAKKQNRGYGVANMWYGIGNTANPNPSGAFVDILDDGTVLILSGCADIGQGSSTTLAQIAAETLGVRFEDVVILPPDTEVTPDAGASSASRQTYVSGNAVRLAAEKARESLISQAAEMLGLPENHITFHQGEVWNAGKPTGVTIREVIGKCRQEGILTLGHGYFNPDTTKLDPQTGYGRPYATYSYATQVVEVEVNTDTGVVEVKKIVAAHDVGTAIHPVNIEGQIEGGCVMGVGYALLEEVTTKEGKIQNPEMSSYLVPTAMDVPEIYPIIIEVPEKTGPFGAKGVGEPALVPTAAAIANAVADALDIRIYDLPLTLERVVAAVE